MSLLLELWGRFRPVATLCAIAWHCVFYDTARAPSAALCTALCVLEATVTRNLRRLSIKLRAPQKRTPSRVRAWGRVEFVASLRLLGWAAVSGDGVPPGLAYYVTSNDVPDSFNTR